jgi:glucose/arabinose dehydrogenase
MNILQIIVTVTLLLNCSLQKNAAENRSKTGDINYTESLNPEMVAGNLTVPWGIDFLPDDVLIFTERIGNVKIVEKNVMKNIGRINVVSTEESGLLGIAVDPEFTHNHRIYVYYTYNTSGKLTNRVSSFALNDSLSDETILLDNIPAAQIHDGGRIAFGPDNLLYVTTGDATNKSAAQDIGSLSGKILRMNKDGSAPADNPFRNLVFAYGLRNSEGLTWNRGIFYATDHGPEKHDEINIIKRGENYGWPQTCTNFPAWICYTDFTLAPAGICSAGSFLFVSGLRGNQIRRINLTDGTQNSLFTTFGRIRAITTHKGFLYFGTSNRDGRGQPKPEDDMILRVPLTNPGITGTLSK